MTEQRPSRQRRASRIKIGLAALLIIVPAGLLLSRETCACGAKAPIWRHVTMAWVEPAIEAAAEKLGLPFKFSKPAL